MTIAQFDIFFLGIVLTIALAVILILLGKMRL